MIVMATRTEWQLITEFLADFLHKRNQWQTAIAQWSLAYKSAFDAYQSQIRRQDQLEAQRMAFCFAVLELVTAGAGKFLTACMPKTGTLPYPGLISQTRRDLFWKKMETLDEFVAQPVNAVLVHFAGAGGNWAYEKSKAPTGPVSAVGADPVEYFLQLKTRMGEIADRLIADLKDFQKTVDARTHLNEAETAARRERIQAACRRLPYWYPPVLPEADKQAVRVELEKCLWALHIVRQRQEWVRSVRYENPHPVPEARGRIVSVQRAVDYWEPEQQIAKYLSRTLEITVNGQPIDAFLGYWTDQSEAKVLYEGWAVPYLERGVRKFGTPFPARVENPYVDHFTGGFRLAAGMPNPQARQHVVTTKDGRILIGELLEATGQTLTLNVNGGRQVIPRSTVRQHVLVDASGRARYGRHELETAR
jgi:hypothetical protein